MRFPNTEDMISEKMNLLLSSNDGWGYTTMESGNFSGR
jgi:hypothetical protein